MLGGEETGRLEVNLYIIPCDSERKKLENQELQFLLDVSRASGL